MKTDPADDLDSTPEEGPIPNWQKEELDRRMAKFKENPASGMTWEEVLRSVRNRHKARADSGDKEPNT